MRLTGHFNAHELEQAHLFVQMLRGVDIRATIDEEGDGRLGVWVYSEDDMRGAAELLERFRANPEAPELVGAARAGETLSRLESINNKRRARRDQLTHMLYRSSETAAVTRILMGISIAVFVVVQLLGAQQVLRMLLVGNYLAGPAAPWWTGLVEIRHGQIWRLFTPVFLHFGLLHIVFNMLWLYDLGMAVERRKGSLFLLLFVMAVSLPAHLAQYAISGPLFGGMSGVVYGLLGYIWMKMRYDPREGYLLHPTTVTIMLIWLLLGFAGVIPRIANTVHGVGLFVGVAWGWLTSRT